MRNINLLCTLLIIMLLGSCKSPPEKPPERVFPVKIGEVTSRDVPIFIDTIGNITAPMIALLRAQINGKLQQIHVVEGAFVKQGELLYTIEPNLFQAALDSAIAVLQKDEALVVLAKETRDRFSKLVTQDYISKLNYDQYVTNVATAEAQVMQDKANVDTAKINLGYCFIHAPWDGKIGNFNVYPGTLVAPTDTFPLTNVRKIMPIEVDFNIAQDEFQRLQARGPTQDYPVEVYMPGQTKGQRGTIFFVDNAVDLTTGTILIKALLPNEDLALWPGEFARVRILLETLENALLVPATAVQIGQQGKFVYVLKGQDHAELRLVTQLGVEGDFAIISEGLAKDETVVTDGQLNIKNGSKVNVVTPTKRDSK